MEVNDRIIETLQNPSGESNGYITEVFLQGTAGSNANSISDESFSKERFSAPDKVDGNSTRLFESRQSKIIGKLVSRLNVNIFGFYPRTHSDLIDLIESHEGELEKLMPGFRSANMYQKQASALHHFRNDMNPMWDLITISFNRMKKPENQALILGFFKDCLNRSFKDIIKSCRYSKNFTVEGMMPDIGQWERRFFVSCEPTLHGALDHLYAIVMNPEGRLPRSVQVLHEDKQIAVAYPKRIRERNSKPGKPFFKLSWEFNSADQKIIKAEDFFSVVAILGGETKKNKAKFLDNEPSF